MVQAVKKVRNVLPAAARRALWRRGELSWKLHAGQRKINALFEKCKRKLFVGDCSRQLGKSVWAVSKALEKAIKKPGAKIRYGTAFFTDLEDFILPAFEFLLEDCPDDLRPTYNKAKGEWRFPPVGKRKTGSVIKLIGLDRKPNGLRGNKLDLTIVDEAGFTARLRRLYRAVIIPSTTHVRDARIIMISTQPETPDHDFVEFCDEADAAGNYICLTVYENPLLTKEDIDKLAEDVGGYDSVDFQREYLCKRIIDATRAIIAEWKPEYAVETVKDDFFQFYAKLNAMDVGVKNDRTVDLFAYYDFKRGKVVVQDEVEMWGPSMRTDILAASIKTKEKELWTKDDKALPVYKRIVDNSDPLLAQDLTGTYNLPFICTDKDSLHAMVQVVKVWAKQGRLEVSPKCTQLIGCLEKGVWNEARDKFGHSKKYGHFDALAALVYLIRYVEKVVQHDNTIPEWFQAENTTKRFQKPKSDLSPLGEELTNLLSPRKKKQNA